MGLFNRLFGGRKPPPERDRPKDEEARSVFATPTDVVEEAFDQIMADVDAPESAKHRLRPLFVKAHRAGDPRRESDVVETAFEGVDWGEAYFGAWRERFQAEGACG